MELSIFKQLLLQPAEIQDYFSLKFVSNSTIGFINPAEGGTPSRYIGAINRNFEKKSSGFSLGSYIHQMLLEPEKFIISNSSPPDKDTKIGAYTLAYYEYLTSPSFELERAKAGIMLKESAHRYARNKAQFSDKFSDDTIKSQFNSAGKAYVDEKIENQDKVFITNEDQQIFNRIKKNIEANPSANGYLFCEPIPNELYTFNEIALTSEFTIHEPITGSDFLFQLKGKFDRLIIDVKNKTIFNIDLKTTGDSIAFFQKAIWKYRYYRQCAFYELLLSLVIENFNEYTVYHKIVAAETTAFNEVRVFNLNRSMITRGQQEVEQLLTRIAYHELNDDWTFSLEELNSTNKEIEVDYQPIN